MRCRRARAQHTVCRAEQTSPHTSLRHEGGDREEANGYNPTTHEVQTYELTCIDCIYYAECGELDDKTMQEIER